MGRVTESELIFKRSILAVIVRIERGSKQGWGGRSLVSNGREMMMASDCSF